MVLRLKRKYLRLRGFQRACGGLRLSVLLNGTTEVHRPVQIRYRRLQLLFKNRPVAHYFAEYNCHTLELVLVQDVDLLHYPYRSCLDYGLLQVLSVR